MSQLLTKGVYMMMDKTAKRGVYPLHGYKTGIFRLPVDLNNEDEILSIMTGLAKTFVMDAFADRIYATYEWTERNMEDEDDNNYEEAKLKITVEIVTGDVVDIIYQVYPIEKYGDYHWVNNYKKKADHFAKMIMDTILRNTIIGIKLKTHFAKTEKISEVAADMRLEEMTPLAKIVLGASIVGKPVEIVESDEEVGDLPAPTEAKEGPIDVEFKTKIKPSAAYAADSHTIKTWGRRGTDNKVMGVWGEFVSVDYDICVADGGCIDACPVDVYEWFDTPGNPASEKKPLMSKEPDCIFCLACENVCPPQAIKIFEMP